VAGEESGGAAADPLAGARAHPCGSAPPLSGLAVVLFRIRTARARRPGGEWRLAVYRAPSSGGA